MVELYLISGKYDLIQKPFSELSESDKVRLAPRVWFALGEKKKMTQAEGEMIDQHNKKIIGSFDVAVNYAFMQRKDLALDYLEKSVDEKYRALGTKGNVFLKSLRGDPRYNEILKRMNLPVD